MRRFMFLAAFVLAVVFVQAVSAAPPGATHVYGSGSTVWGDGTQSFKLNVFRKADGNLGGHMSWHGVTSTPYNQPLDYSGHPDCLAVSGNIAVTSVVHYYPGQVFAYQGAIEIAVDNGSVDQAWGELLEAGDKASAQGVCRDTLDALSGYGPLPTLNGEVTVAQSQLAGAYRAVHVPPFEKKDNSPFVGLLQVEAASHVEARASTRPHY